MRYIACDKCAKHFDGAYADILVCLPGTYKIVSEFNICKACMAEGLTIREKQDPSPTKALAPGGPKNNGSLN